MLLGFSVAVPAGEEVIKETWLSDVLELKETWLCQDYFEPGDYILKAEVYEHSTNKSMELGKIWLRGTALTGGYHNQYLYTWMRGLNRRRAWGLSATHNGYALVIWPNGTGYYYDKVYVDSGDDETQGTEPSTLSI